MVIYLLVYAMWSLFPHGMCNELAKNKGTSDDQLIAMWLHDKAKQAQEDYEGCRGGKRQAMYIMSRLASVGRVRSL
jgi:hypothetical protein